jgi:hypothetical protein
MEIVTLKEAKTVWDFFDKKHDRLLFFCLN